MIKSFSNFVVEINQTKKNFSRFRKILVILQALIIAITAISLWTLISPQNDLEQIYLGFLTFVATIIASFKKTNKSEELKHNDLLLALEMQYGRDHSAPLTSISPEDQIPDSWNKQLKDIHTNLVVHERKRYLALASSLILPVLISALTIPKSVPSFRLAMNEVSKVVSLFTQGATLRALQGSTGDTTDKTYQLSTKSPIQLELLAQNLVEITLNGGAPSTLPPIVELRRRKVAENAKSIAESDPNKDETLKTTSTVTDLSVDDQPLSTAPLPWEKTTSTAGQENPQTKDLTSTDQPDNSLNLSPDNKTVDSANQTQVESLLQRFQLMPLRDSQNTAADNEKYRYQISFAVSESVDLYIPSIDSDRPLAHLIVKQLPIPKVSMVPIDSIQDPWPDDQPLNLRIQVSAENPLQLVRLIIKSGTRVAKELVANVMTEDRTSLTSEYRILLEPYVESDLAQVEIIAEAIDRALPTPLVGQSQPLRINTASAYGRYRAALETLRTLKNHIDDAVSKKLAKLSEESLVTAQKAVDQSENSPFFDGLDRVQIHRFSQSVASLVHQSDFENMFDLSQAINDFLFEHEILDDRERDRDFFVATRSLSRVIEEDSKKRPASLKTITDRLQHFLDDRQKRWEKRLERLKPEDKPSQWSKIIQEKPFHKAIEQVHALNEQGRQDPKVRSTQMTILSTTVSDYRAWIEELETKEDKSREQQERQRQEGLASARNALRELQQRQGEISAELDRADVKDPKQIAEQWVSTRMKQSTNARDTKQLEGQIRALAPSAGARIQAAVTAMESTIESGNAGDFSQSESSSDLAGRLLRQAERAASQSQQKRQNRGRRRRVTGDNYYGQSIVGDDIEIKRNYEVDRRYREDILEQIRDTNMDDEQRTLLENYLREIVR